MRSLFEKTKKGVYTKDDRGGGSEATRHVKVYPSDGQSPSSAA